MADVDYEINLISGIHEILPNRAGGFAVQENLETLGPLSYTSEELDFAYKIQAATSKPKLGINGKITSLKPTAEHTMGGSTDVGDVRFLVQVVRLGVPQGDSGEKLNRFATAECQLLFSTICRTRFMKLPITHYGNLIGSDNQCP